MAYGSCQRRGPKHEVAAVFSHPQFRASRTSDLVETAMRAMITWNGFPKVRRCIRRFPLASLLPCDRGLREILIQKSRNDLVADDCLRRGDTNINFAALLMGGPVNPFGWNCGLVGWPHGPSAA